VPACTARPARYTAVIGSAHAAARRSRADGQPRSHAPARPTPATTVTGAAATKTTAAAVNSSKRPVKRSNHSSARNRR